MPVVGVAEILVVPSFKGTQSKIGKEFTGMSQKEGKKAGGFMSNALSTAAGIGIAKTGAVLAKGLGAAFTKGFSRLQAIEQAKAKLTGLGHSAQNVELIMTNANAAVKGTAFGLGEAATVAANAVAAGVKPGQDLERTLKLVSDASTIAGTDMASMGAIFNKAAASNKVQMDVINQLHDAGVPALQLIANELGVTAEEASKMASKGEVDFATFQNAMEKGMGGAAQESGKTLKGAFDNSMAAIGRFGANLMEGVYPQVRDFFNGFIQFMQPLEQQAKVVGEAVGKFLGKVTKGIQGVFEILVQGNFSGVLRETFGIEEDHPLVNFLFNVRDIIGEVIGGIKAFGAAWVYNDGEITSSGLPGFMERLGYYARQTFDFLMQHKEILAALTGAIIGWVAVMKTVAIIKQIKGWITAATAAQWGLNAAMQFFTKTNIIGLIVAGIAALVAAFIYLWKNNEGFRNFFIGAWEAIKGAVGAAVEWIRGALSNMGEFFSSIWQWVQQTTDAAVSWIGGALSGLGEFFSSVWRSITDAVGTGVEFIRNAAGSIAGFFRDTVAPAFTWLYENIVKPVWEGIKLAITIALTPIVAAGMALVWFYKNVLAPVFTWLYENVVKRVWSGIQKIIDFVVRAVQGYINLWVSLFRNVLAPAFQWILNNIVTPVMNGIRAGIAGMWNFVKSIFVKMDLFIRTVLALAFTWFRDSVITPVWNWIKSTISNTWNGIKQIFWNIVNFIRGVLSAAFTWLRDSIITPVWNGIKWLTSAWWNGIKLIFSTAISFVRNSLAKVFTWLRDSVITPVWNGIKNVISSVWDKGIKPVFERLRDFVMETLPNAFKKGVDFIEQVWKKVANVARKPINFIVETVYNKGLVAAFNGVADTIKLDEKWRLKPAAPIPEFYRGGWTGPGSKYDEAGIVHADEFVVRKESQRDLRRKAPGLLDAINRYGAAALGYANGGLVRPVRGGRMTSGFGSSRGRYPHAGLDLAVPVGTPVFASMAGTVLRAAMNAITGRTGLGVFLGHEGGRNTYYGHLSKLLVKAGETVRKGQKIALSGNTGKSSGPHLHWETWTGGKAVNPAPYLSGALLPAGAEGADGGGGWNPLAPILALKDSMVGKFKKAFAGGNFWTEMAGGAVTRLITGPVDWIREQFAKIGDFTRDSWGNVKDFFNGPDSAVQKAVRGVAAGYGWDSGRHWNALSNIIKKESSWDPNAANPGSTARGLFQIMESYHGKVPSDPAAQARQGLKYIQGRYGDPEKAWKYWRSHGSYADGGLVKPMLFDQGGVLPPGLNTILNATGKPEAILNPRQWDAVIKSIEVARQVADGKSVTQYNYHAGESGGSAKDFFDTAAFEERKLSRTGGRR